MSVPTLFAPPAEVQTIFDAMRAALLAYPEVVNINSYATVDPNGNTVGITVVDKWGSQVNYSLRTNTGKVFLEPMTASLASGGTVQFTATTLDATGSPVPATVTWSLQAGALGTISPTGLYTAPATITGASAEYCTAMDAVGASATASIQLHL
jgi:hypothetical protein